MLAMAAISSVCVFAVLFLSRFFVALWRDCHPSEQKCVEYLGVHRHVPFDDDGTRQRVFEAPTPRHIPLTDGRSASRIMGALFLLGTMALHPQHAHAQQPTTSASGVEWQYGGFVDAAYLKGFNEPLNGLFRSRGTAYKLDEPLINMSAVYLRKPASETSRWGLELTAQAGQDTRVFGFSATAPNLPGSEGLRHLGPTNVSYLAPVGKGLTIQAGIFSSLIGYDSLYARDNLNYTRPWGADFTPYLMLGINASYAVTNKLTVTGFVVNDYFHLADPNSTPSVGAQFAYKATPHVNLKQTVMYGPHQDDASLGFWRFLSDSIAECKTDRVTTAFEYHVGTEQVAAIGHAQATWMAAQIPLHFAFHKNWGLTERPEVYWDNTGRLTGFAQTVKANTLTLDYRIPYKQAAAILRLEYRVDDSRGPSGGFFSDRFASPGVIALQPTQHLLGVALILTLDATFRH